MKKLMLAITLWSTLALVTSASAQTDSTMLSHLDSIKLIPGTQADRPDQTETAFIVPRGYFQMELGFSIEDTEPGFIYSYPSALWKFGVNDHFELRLITEFVTIQKEPNPDHNGVLPITVGFKSKLTEQKGVWPKTSFLGHLKFPGLVSDDLETTYLAPEVRLAFYNGVSDFFSIGYNLGIEWDGERPDPNYFFSLSPGIAITDHLGLYVEGYGYIREYEEDEIEFRMDAGLTYRIGNNMLLDVSAGKGITANAPESYVAVGFSYRFKA